MSIKSSSPNTLGKDLTIAEMYAICGLRLSPQTAMNRLAHAGIKKVAAYSKAYQTADLTRERLGEILRTVRPPQPDSREMLGEKRYETDLSIARDMRAMRANKYNQD